MTIIKKLLNNPALGLLPFLTLSIMAGSLDMRIALLISLSVSVIAFFIVPKPSRLIFDLSIVTFIISLILSYIIVPRLDRFSALIVIEILFVFSLIITRLSRRNIIKRLAKKNKPHIKNYLTESFRVAFLAQYGLSIHLLIVLAYFIFTSPKQPLVDMLTIKVFIELILITIIILEFIRLRMMDDKFEKEEWIPVVNEKGYVTGKIAKSVTKDMKNKFMHPVIRVAIIYNKKIFLTERSNSLILDPGKLDYPFEKYIKFNNNPGNAADELIRNEYKIDNLPHRFLLKYVFENDTTKRLIFLYVMDIRDEELFNKLNLGEGKLWTESQIDDNISNGIFCECFEMEYEYLKNTVLMYQNIRSTSKTFNSDLQSLHLLS